MGQVKEDSLPSALLSIQIWDMLTFDELQSSFYFFIYFKYFTYLFLERGEGKEKERETNISVWVPIMCPLLGTWPATQACALTGNLTGGPLVCRLALNPLSHTSQGQNSF